MPTLVEIANEKPTIVMPFKEATLYNPYEGQICARQLVESVDEFLNRLPPATTPAYKIGPWIFIVNPYRTAPKAFVYEQEKMPCEGPQEEESDLPRFVVLGGEHLEELVKLRHEEEKKDSGRTKAAITKSLSSQRDGIVTRLLNTAVDLHITSGKVSIFIHALPN
jgi:hypothetical protein